MNGNGYLIITPQQFGAVGDGLTDDREAIMKAVRAASKQNAVLELLEATYACFDWLEFDRVKIVSHNAKILYYGFRLDAPAIQMYNDVEIIGKLTVWANDDKQDHYGQRAGMAFGDFYTGDGSHGCHVEHIVLTGGITNANGIVIVGDSSDIKIDRVTVPTGTNICRGVCIHWGNRRAHHTAEQIGTGFDPAMGEKGYVHDENGGPTTHPHDIHLGVVDCADFRPIDGRPDNDKSAVTICASYDITVDEIIMHDSCHALCVTGADLGFEYAAPEVKKIGSRNIRVKKIFATGLRSAGIFVCSRPWYLKDANVNAKVQIDECVLEAADGNRNVGVSVVGAEEIRLSKVIVKNYQYHNTDILIQK